MGFDVAVFLAGSTFIVLTLRIIEMFMGHGVYDLVVLGACWLATCRSELRRPLSHRFHFVALGPLCLSIVYACVFCSPTAAELRKGLIAAYHTKPAVKSFDGRPMREMLALRQELKQRARPPARQPSGLDGLIGGLTDLSFRANLGVPISRVSSLGISFLQERFRSPSVGVSLTRAVIICIFFLFFFLATSILLGQVVAGGKQLVKEMVADVSDAAVPVAFTDCHVFVLAEAKFNARGERRGDNVFYVGAFSRWFNVNAQLTAAVLALDAKLRAVAARPPPPRR